MLMWNKILVAYEKDGSRHIGGDMNKAALMLLKERRHKQWYPTTHQPLIDDILLAADGKRALQYLNTRKAEGHQWESFSIIELETASYLRPCPDITARYHELVEYAKCNHILGNKLFFEWGGYTEEEFNNGDCLNPKDYTIFTFYDNNWDELYDYTSFFQDWFGDVKITYYCNKREVEIERR